MPAQAQKSDQDLIEEYLRGSPTALARLWLRYDRMIYGTALGILCNRERAEDVRQEVFLKVHSQLAHIRDVSRFGSWLCTVTRNACTSHLRRKAVRSTPRTADQETEVQPSFEVDLEERQHRGLLRQMIERLPEDYRIPIVLHYFEEQSIKEMSEFMEQPETTVKWRLHKGREMLLQEAEVRGYRTKVGSGE